MNLSIVPRRPLGMAAKRALTLAALVTLLVSSAIAAVYAKHESRKLFMALSALIDERDRLETDWSRLQMEQSAVSTHSRVEQLAREQMHMHNPRPDEVELLTP
jgi:cell division protein FtsL